MTKEPIMIDKVDVSRCGYLNKEHLTSTKETECYKYGICNNQTCEYKNGMKYQNVLEQLKRKEQELETWKKELDKTHLLMLEKQDELVKEILKNDQLKIENDKLTGYKSLFEKTRNLWNEARINSYKLLDEIKDLKDSLKRTTCQSECYKHKEAEELKQALQEIKQIAEDDCKTCTVKLLGEDEINCKRCYKTKILQKCEVINE